MRNLITSLIAGVLTFLFIACSEDNPSNVSIISSNEESSGSIVVESSSSEDLAIYSSSLNAFSSIAETSSSSWEPYSYGKLIDERDGQTYKTIKLGEQTWMAENLNYAYLQPTTTKDSSSECFNNDPDNCAKFGRLYLWSAAMDSAGIFSLDGKGCGKGSGSCKVQPAKGVRGVCPQNWHIPNEIDKKNFFDNPKVTNNWMVHYWLLAENEDNEYKTEIKSRYKFFWTSEQSANDKVTGLFFLNNILTTAHENKEIAYPVRCVKDDEKYLVEHGELKDERDGQVYKTVKIGDQWWMAENLNFAYSLPTSKKDSSNTNDKKTESKEIYGKLYRWSIAMDSAAVFSHDGKGCGKGVNCGSQPSKGVRGICPENWHIPNETDIKNIIDYSNESYDKLIWLEHYWFLTENEDNEFKTEMKLRYEDFWTSAQIDRENAKGLCFGNNKILTSNSSKGLAYPIRCVKDDEKYLVEHGELKDERDGQVYKTVRIGNQWWMAENLNYDYSLLFNSSDTISWCYNNDPDNCAKYGRLYLWIAAMNCEHLKEVEDFYNIEADDPYLYLSIMGACYVPVKVLTPLRGICPENWHVPSYDEWVELQNTVNNFAIDLKSTTDWLNDGNGSNVLGFNALPAGEVQDYYPEKFFGIEEKACFWTTQQFYGEIRSEGEWIEDYTNIFCFTAKSKEISKKEIDKYELGLSLRCVRDSTSKE